ncbi:MAG: hypothetical protein CVU59_09985 [Deltaproteobacteria bacterium HGW-Deltaproteobacteria-17]|nr:MAG: hypothetical protein CVU59_09985 [Deltaproteobacteria bacterium HGW-Deltaproteobacteria-17]
MKEILLPYLKQQIGINFERAFKIEAAELIDVTDTYFSIRDARNGNVHYFSWHAVVQIIENPAGIEVGGLFTHKETFTITVKVGHLTEYVPV